MCRRCNQKKIDDELKNAQIFSDKMLEIEKKERKVLSEMDDLEISKMYLSRQKKMQSKEKELIHIQQQTMRLNEKKLNKQKDLLSSDQTYIQQEYIDAKDKFENDRYVLLDRINKLETEHSKYKLDNASFKKQLSLKQEMCINLEEQLEKLRNEIFLQKQENGRLTTKNFLINQKIENLQQELLVNQYNLKKIINDNKLNDKNNLKQFQEFSTEINQLKNENAVLIQQNETLKDEIELFKIKKNNKKKLSSKKIQYENHISSKPKLKTKTKIKKSKSKPKPDNV